MNFGSKTILGLLFGAFLNTYLYAGDISRDNTQFAINLYHQLQKDDGNLFFSPYSISTALSMTYAGARDQTAAQMATSLCFSMPKKDVSPAFFKLQNHLNSIQRQGNVQLTIANSLWPQKGHPFLRSYLHWIKEYYDNEITELDFIKNTEKSRKTINNWVEKKTNDKIRNLIQKGDLSSLTRLAPIFHETSKKEW